VGEIKSTLELVMERTRNMTLSQEEKEAQSTREFKDSLSGLLLKFQSGILNLGQFEKELDHLRERSGVRGREILLEELAGRIDPDQDIGWILSLLTDICRVNTSKIESAVKGLHDALNSEASERKKTLRDQLSRERGISGSAVNPNLNFDEEWGVRQESIREEFKRSIEQEVAALMAACKS
jgi:hypothetical protein